MTRHAHTILDRAITGWIMLVGTSAVVCGWFYLLLLRWGTEHVQKDHHRLVSRRRIVWLCRSSLRLRRFQMP